jgi:hypothetical protein
VPLTPTHRITPDAGTGSLEDQVRQELAGQQRYRWLTVSVRNQMVYLDGAAYNWEDVHALARSLARLPGVERVVIEQITVLSENPPARR